MKLTLLSVLLMILGLITFFYFSETIPEIFGIGTHIIGGVIFLIGFLISFLHPSSYEPRGLPRVLPR